MIDDLLILHHKLALTLLRATLQRNPHILMVNHLPVSSNRSGNDDQALSSIRVVYGSAQYGKNTRT